MVGAGLPAMRPARTPRNSGIQQPIPHPRLSHDKPWLSRVIRQLLAQMPYHNAQVVTVFSVGRPPDILEQLLLGDYPATIAQGYLGADPHRRQSLPAHCGRAFAPEVGG